MKNLAYSVLLILFSFQVLGEEKVNPTTVKILEEVVSELNKSMPIQLSKTLQVEKLSTTGEEVTYHYKSSVSDKRTFQIKRFIKDMTGKLTKKVCYESSQKLFRDNDVVVNYKYMDKNDNHLTTISVNAGECN
jgi:hypothetical protein